MGVVALVGTRSDVGRVISATVNNTLQCGLRVTVIDLARDSAVRRSIRGARSQIDYYEVLGPLKPAMVSRFLKRVKTRATVVDVAEIPEEHQAMMARLNTTKGDLLVIHGMDKSGDWVSFLGMIKEELEGVPYKLVLGFEKQQLDFDGIPDPDAPDPLKIFPTQEEGVVLSLPELPSKGKKKGSPPPPPPRDPESGDEWKKP